MAKRSIELPPEFGAALDGFFDARMPKKCSHAHANRIMVVRMRTELGMLKLLDEAGKKLGK